MQGARGRELNAVGAAATAPKIFGAPAAREKALQKLYFCLGGFPKVSDVNAPAPGLVHRSSQHMHTGTALMQ